MLNPKWLLLGAGVGLLLWKRVGGESAKAMEIAPSYRTNIATSSKVVTSSGGVSQSFEVKPIPAGIWNPFGNIPPAGHPTAYGGGQQGVWYEGNTRIYP